MNVIIALIIIDTIMQLALCKFHLWFLIVLICRILFCLRIVGATFKVSKLVVGEGVALACMVLWNMLFAGDNFPWLRILLFAVFSLISAGLMFLDNLLYVYVIEDEES